jgi:N6-adenosine-specific RNA methylase IME4
MLSIIKNKGPFAAIIADPPWRYGSPKALVGNGGRGSMNGAAAKIIQADVEDHYDTMSIEEIAALDVAGLTAKNALLFMWITNPMLAEAAFVPIFKAWGFTPKSVLTWAKVKHGEFTPSMKTGHWFRSASEHVIFGVKGTPKRPWDYPAIPTWFAGERAPHSVKPERIHEIAESAIDGPRLEMFARRPKPGWVTWGNEVDVIFEEASHLE